MPGDRSCHGVEILDMVGGTILGRRSDPVTPWHLVLATVTSDTPLQDLVFSPVATVPPSPVPGLMWTSYNFQPSDNVFTAHYIGPK